MKSALQSAISLFCKTKDDSTNGRLFVLVSTTLFPLRAPALDSVNVDYKGLGSTF